MLTQIRDRATGWFAWFIVILISIPFALWGVNEYFAGGDNLEVAVVNGNEIDQQTYRYALEDRRGAMRRMLGNNFDPEIVNSLEFKRAVVDGLIQQTLLTENANDAGYRVSDEQLRAYIQSAPQFQSNNQFDPGAYERAVASLGYSKTGFEAYLRQQNVLEQIRTGFERTAFLTKSDEEMLLRLSRQTRKFDYAVLDPTMFMDAEVGEEEIVSEYEENADRYREPEMIKVDYVLLSVDALGENFSPTEEELLSAYEQTRDQYTEPGQRTASHILIKLDGDADPAAEEAALAKAADLAQRARAGEDFAELAKAHSEDPGSARNGGDLGTVTPGVMVKPFEDALFAMQAGEISDPVKTRFGYHVIKLTSLVEAKIKPFAEVREQLAEQERSRRAESDFIDKADLFQNLAFEQPETLEPVVTELSLKLETSDWFSADSGTGIAANRKVRDAAFSDDVYIENLNSEAIEIDINTLLVLRKKEARESRLKSLEEVRDEIVNNLKTEQARVQAATRGEALVKQLRDGEDWDAILAANGLNGLSAERTRVQAQSDPPRQVVDSVFRLPRPTTGPVYGGMDLNNGVYYLYRLTAAELGNIADVDDQGKQQTESALLARRGSDYFRSYQIGLRQAADVEVFDEQL